MSEKIVQLNEEIIKGQLKELVRGSVEETLNELLEKEAESLTQAARYERSEIRRRTRVVGTFPDGNSALMLVCARLRHVAGTQWGCKKYMNMKHLEAALDDAFIAG